MPSGKKALVVTEPPSITQQVLRITLGIVLLIVFHIGAKLVSRAFVRVMIRQPNSLMLSVTSEEGNSAKTENSVSFDVIGSIMYWIIMLIGLVIILRLFGIETTSMIAVLGTFGFAFGLATQGALSDLSSGILLSIGGDFSIGDLIEVDGIVGKVDKFNLLYTTVLHNDTYHLVKIPNRVVYGTVLHNHTKLPRSVLITVMIGNENKGIDRALRAVESTLLQTDGVLQTPLPRAQVAKIHAFGTDLEVRVAIRPDLFPNKENYNFVNNLYHIIRETLIANDVTLPDFSYTTALKSSSG